nr:N-acetylmuramoyl-L-alanine amidase CwlD [Pelagirhabdus alkalitolerans]
MLKIVSIVSWLVGFFLLVFLMSGALDSRFAEETSLPLPLTGEVIVIDPGHGGVDGGAVAPDGTLEKDITLQVSEYLQDYLQQAGALVYLTREADRDLANEGTTSIAKRKVEDINARAQFIENKEAALFLSVHLNAVSSQKWSGAQTFFHASQQDSKQLATSIQNQFKSNLDTNRDAMQLNRIFLLKHASCPAALVEIGFLSNQKERALLKTDIYQKRIAASIYYGILDFYDEENTSV